MTEDPLKKDFRKFVWLVWNHLNLPDPTPVQYDIASYLQGGPKRAVIEAFRGVGKSWITAAFVLWCLYRDPQLKIMVVSASGTRADAFSTFTKRLIYDIPVLQHLMPKEDQRRSNVAFDVGPALPDQSPSVKSVGITGQLTGSRADIIVADDIEVPSNSATQVQRDKLSELVKEFDAVLKPLATSRIIYLGTPQTEMSLYNQLEERGYVTRIWTAQYPNEKQVAAYGHKLAPWIIKHLENTPDLVGKPVDPKRFGLVDLQERQASYGKQGYALQFMLDTSLSDANKYPLKLSDLIVVNMDLSTEAPEKLVWATSPDLILNELPNVGFVGDRYHRPMVISDTWKAFTGSMMAIDPAGRGTDETAYCVIKMLYGQLFLVAAGGFSKGYDEETLTSLAEIAKEHKVNQVVIEANFGDGMFTKLISPVFHKIHPCGIEEVKHSTQKEKRIIDTLEPVMMQHKLVVLKKVIEKDWDTAPEPQYSLFHQMVRITNERGALVKDDRLDVLAIGVNYWVEQMSQDVDKMVSKAKEKALNAELKRFKKSVFGKSLYQRNAVLSAQPQRNRGR
jgi:hypothetical protein